VTVQHRGARVGRNPTTGEEVRIRARAKPVFRPTRGLLDAVERSHDTPSLALLQALGDFDTPRLRGCLRENDPDIQKTNVRA
jgi:hypothetical protein